MSFWLSYFARFVLSLPNHLQTQAHTHTHAKQQHTRPRKQQILTEGENEPANTSSKIEIARESSNPIKSKFMLFWWVFGLKIWNSEISFKRRLKHMTDFRIQCAVLCFAFFRIFISRSFQKQQQNNKNKRAPHTLVCSPIEWPLWLCSSTLLCRIRICTNSVWFHWVDICDACFQHINVLHLCTTKTTKKTKLNYYNTSTKNLWVNGFSWRSNIIYKNIL